MNGEAANEPQFYANATLGFRQWHFSPGVVDTPTSLESVVRFGFHEPRYRWDLGGPNHARCLRLRFQPSSFYESHGQIPEKGCSCGFHAYGSKNISNSETAIYVVGGVVAGWGNLELHERGFRCSVAKILALFEPDTRKRRADYAGVAEIQSEALAQLCAENGIPLLEPDALVDEEDLRRYAAERDLALLEDQLNH